MGLKWEYMGYSHRLTSSDFLFNPIYEGKKVLKYSLQLKHLLTMNKQDWLAKKKNSKYLKKWTYNFFKKWYWLKKWKIFYEGNIFLKSYSLRSGYNHKSTDGPLQWFDLWFFNFMMVWTWYEFSKNCTSNFNFYLG